MKVLEQLGISREDVLEKIAERAFEAVFEDRETSEQEYIDEIVCDKLEKEVKNLVEQAHANIVEKVNAIMYTAVEQVFNEPFQRINVWGEPEGEPTTIKDMIALEAKNYWEQKVDSRGNVSSYTNAKPRAEYYATKIIEHVYDKQLEQQSKALAQKLKAKIPETIGDEVAKTIKNYLA